jgi:hypothetical protein
MADEDRTQRVTRLVREIQLDNKRIDPNDTPAQAELRARLVADIDAIVERNGVVEIPTELP